MMDWYLIFLIVLAFSALLVLIVKSSGGWLHEHQAVEAIVDPSSQQLSMSRFLLGVIVLVYWPLNVLCDVLLRLFHAGKMENWAVLGVMTGAIAGVYWFNSTAGAWQRYSSMTFGVVRKAPGPPETKPEGS